MSTVVKLIERKVTLVGIPVYTCNSCGLSADGSTVTIEVSSIDQIEKAVWNIGPSHMPVGWACYGKHVVKCPTCKT